MFWRCVFVSWFEQWRELYSDERGRSLNDGNRCHGIHRGVQISEFDYTAVAGDKAKIPYRQSTVIYFAWTWVETRRLMQTQLGSSRRN